MKGGLVVPHFGINIIKENLTRLSVSRKRRFESLWVYDRMLYLLHN